MANRIHSTGLRRPIGRRRSVEAGDHEVLVDAWTRQVRAGLSGPLSGLYPALARPVGNPSWPTPSVSYVADSLTPISARV